MKLELRSASIMISLCLSAVAQAAQSGPNASSPPVAPGLEIVAGKWTIETGSSDPAHKVTVHEDCNWARGHSALVCDIQTTGSFGQMHGMSVHTYDPTSGTYRYSAVTSIGSTELSEGKMLDAGTIQWNGKMSMFGHTISTRLTIKRVSDTEEQVLLENQQADGSFTTNMQARRVRQS